MADSSGCEALQNEPERFAGYIIADKNLRSKIYNADSMSEVARKVFASDPSLKNIMADLDKHGKDVNQCLGKIFSSPEIQTIVKVNVKTKREGIKKKVKKGMPELKGWDLRREIDKRLKRSIGATTRSIKKEKQVTIDQATKPVKVENYERRGEEVTGYRRAKASPFSTREKVFLRNRLGKPAQQVIQEYQKQGIAQGFSVRSKESVRKQYYRLKWKSESKPLYAMGLRGHR